MVFGAIHDTFTKYSEYMPALPSNLEPFLIKLSDADISTLWSDHQNAQPITKHELHSCGK